MTVRAKSAGRLDGKFSEVDSISGAACNALLD